MTRISVDLSDYEIEKLATKIVEVWQKALKEQENKELEK